MKKEKEIVLELKDVRKYYGEDESCIVRALDGVSLKVREGDFTTIIGPSGSGKSTMLHMIGLLDQPTKGEIYVDRIDTSNMSDGKKAELRKNKIGFVFQTFNLIPSLTALENVEIPQILLGKNKDERGKRAREILKSLGILERQGHYPNQLSAGEKQRVAIARALVNDPEVILADEPTGNLDSKRGEEILEILRELNKKGKTVIVITHDQNIARKSKKVIRLKDGRIVGR